MEKSMQQKNKFRWYIFV